MIKQKILLLMCHWIGDTFWAIQVIPELRKTFPHAEIWAGVKPWSKDLLYGLINDDKILILNNVISDRKRESFSLPAYFRELKSVRKCQFDIVIDLTSNRYSALFGWFSGIKTRAGLSLHKLSFLYTLRGPDFQKGRHLSQRPWEIIKLLCNDSEMPKNLFPPKSSLGKVELEKGLGVQLEGKIALLAPGAGWPAKEWGIDNFAKCGKFLIDNRYKAIVCGSEKERSLCEKLASKLNEQCFIFIRPLKEFIALLPYISIAITNDSGPSHLCAAAKVSLAAIFMVDNHKEYCPMGDKVKVIIKDEATPDRVIKAIKELEGI